MKSIFFSAILIAAATINTVSAVEYVSQLRYMEYDTTCRGTAISKCNTVENCMPGKGKLIEPLFIFHVLILLLYVLSWNTLGP